MKKILIFILTLNGAGYLNAGSVSVSNSSGRENVWGAIYYVFSGSAQRTGNVQQISGQSMFVLPSEDKPKAARYLIISRSSGLLEPIITDPFGTVGVRLIPVGASQAHGMVTSVEIQRGQLPDEKV